MAETADTADTDPEIQQQSASFIEPDVRHSHRSHLAISGLTSIGLR
jgi:hypothetical protein